MFYVLKYVYHLSFNREKTRPPLVFSILGGQLVDGLLMKMMAIVGSGGKALKFYVFGPE